MDRMTERFDCSDAQLKKALKRLVATEGYSQFFSERVRDGMGLRTPDDSSIRVTVKDGLVAVEMLSAGPAAVGTLGMFLKDLHRALGMVEKPMPAKAPLEERAEERPTEKIAPQAVPVPVSAPTPAIGLPERIALMYANASGSVRAALSTMIPVKLLLIVSLVVLLVSALVGGGAGYAMRDPVEQPEYVQMVKEKDANISDLNAQVATAEEKAESLQSTVDELQPYKDEHDKKQSELSDRKAELEKQKAELDKQKSDQESKQKELDQKSADLDAREAAVQQRESSAAAAPTYTDSGSTGYSSAGTSTDSTAGTGADSGYAYYKNCAAARAAGAAPLYRGQPGYRSALDRDNDGIACEWS